MNTSAPTLADPVATPASTTEPASLASSQMVKPRRQVVLEPSGEAMTVASAPTPAKAGNTGAGPLVESVESSAVTEGEMLWRDVASAAVHNGPARKAESSVSTGGSLKWVIGLLCVLGGAVAVYLFIM